MDARPEENADKRLKNAWMKRNAKAIIHKQKSESNKLLLMTKFHEYRLKVIRLLNMSQKLKIWHELKDIHASPKLKDKLLCYLCTVIILHLFKNKSLSRADFK